MGREGGMGREGSRDGREGGREGGRDREMGGREGGSADVSK